MFCNSICSVIGVAIVCIIGIGSEAVSLQMGAGIHVAFGVFLP